MLLVASTLGRKATVKPEKIVKAEVETEPEHFEHDIRSNRQLVDYWDDHMQGIGPSDIATIVLPKKGKEVFFEEVKSLPCSIRGAFYLFDPEAGPIDFQVSSL